MKYRLLVLLLLNQAAIFAQIPIAKIDSIVQKAYENKAFNGNLLIAKGGRIVFEKSMGFADFNHRIPLNKSTQFQIASVSKQFTAFGIMVLKKRGKLNYDDKVKRFIPDFPYPDINLRHLMQHTSGLPDFWKDIRPQLDTTRANGNAEMIAYLIEKKLPLRFETGEKWEYSDIGYDILASIIEIVSGQAFDQFMKKEVFRPARMKDSEGLLVTDIRRIKAKNLARGYLEHSSGSLELAHEARNFVHYLGNFYGDGSVIATLRDLKRWDDALLKMMKSDSLHFGAAYEAIRRKNGSILEVQKGVSYGFGWSLRVDPKMGRIYSHNGGHPGFVTNYFRYPERKIVLIVCRNVESQVAFSPYLQAIRDLLPLL